MTRQRAAKGTRNAVLVMLKQPYRGNTLWLFGSKAAIYDYLPSNVVGVALSTLQSHIDLHRKPYENNLCTIQRIVLHGKRQSNKNTTEQ